MDYYLIELGIEISNKNSEDLIDSDTYYFICNKVPTEKEAKSIMNNIGWSSYILNPSKYNIKLKIHSINYIFHKI